MDYVYATDTILVYSTAKNPIPHSEPVQLVRGEQYASNDPIVKARPDLFTAENRRPIRSTETASGLVEDATARPGEKRSTRRPKNA